MKRMLIRYQAKPESAEENRRLIEAVFRELHAKSPAGIRYLVLQLDDGSFVHFVEMEEHAKSLSDLAAFRTFQAGVRERCVEFPRSTAASIVGEYPISAARLDA
jgi:hypothetical protein